METIFTRQNEEKNINKLAAQKQLYIEAKKVFFNLLILAVPVTISIAIMKIILSFFWVDIAAYANIYSIIIVGAELILMNFTINNYKKDAAKIQEDFDCTVYNLEWHKILAGKKPKIETINKYSEIFKGSSEYDPTKLRDWYPTELATKEHLKAILYCQKTNLLYDMSVRKQFLSLILKTSIISFFVLLVSALVGHVSLSSFIVQLVTPFLPIFTVSAKIFMDHNKTVKNSLELQEIIDDALENEDHITEKNIRSIQDKIYNSRKDGGLVPEIFYKCKRDNLEVEMHKNASNY